MGQQIQALLLGICYHKIAQKGVFLTKQGVNSVFYVEK